MALTGTELRLLDSDSVPKSGSMVDRTILGSSVASAGLGYWTSPSRMPSSLVQRYWASALVVGWVVGLWLKNHVYQ